MSEAIHIQDYEDIVFFTGAGISAESGVPTYRGAGGIWKEYDYEEYACQEAFDRNPSGVWEFHNYRRELLQPLKPNLGHLEIARLEAEGHKVTVITQNIDGMHQLAGSHQVLELHGSLWKVRCPNCSYRGESREAPLQNTRCSGCGSTLRPAITWFGDGLDAEVLGEAERRAASCQLLISVGTSGVVMPAALMPILAKRAGATLVEINPEETEMSHIFDHRLRGTATEMIPKLTQAR